MVEEFVLAAEKRYGRRGYIEDKKRMMFDWTDYAVVTFTSEQL